MNPKQKILQAIEVMERKASDLLKESLFKESAILSKKIKRYRGYLVIAESYGPEYITKEKEQIQKVVDLNESKFGMWKAANPDLLQHDYNKDLAKYRSTFSKESKQLQDLKELDHLLNSN